MSFKGISAIVTGGASGLGLAVTKKLLVGGGRVVVCDISKSPAFDEIAEDCIYSQVDVTSESDAIRAIGLAKKQFHTLNALVNCAGMGQVSKIFNVKRNQPHSLDMFEKSLRVNATGTFNMIRLAAMTMKENDPDKDNLRGVIINTASVAAFEGQTGQVAYAASKAAVVGMTLPLARELSDQGIRVVTIAPGLFNSRTVLGKEGFREESTEYLSDLQLGISRLGRPEEFADLVLDIICNPFVNGATIRLDGGGRLVYL
ncbi:unnamed protein product [Calicophoron daubneyi]|uniref:Ketoreductase domain-containing protein n=1 Tax=Calicophoron daubneyi TaxID=300641 RepID=A0AAV2TS82_CALDB